MGEAFQAEHRGRIFERLWPVTSYLFTNLTAAVGVLLFFVLNRTTVIGRDRLPQDRNTLLLSNHQTMIDSWLVGISAYYPQSFWRPWLIPWNPAARENFFKNPVLALFSDLWKAIPIREGRRDYRALYRMLRALKDGSMVLFPEG
ncbi:MAG TPA: lysophospholipid acyltransferase family protein, partial [Gemmatimonadota bacterium]|nr:lysophospholipid acyltransferase family protein [Gemmatimonadota bacterium]